MCKTKKSTNATNPSPSTRSPPPQQRRSTGSNTGPSSGPSSSNATRSATASSSHTSSSSATSLSSIRSSLSEKPRIYSYSEISAATNNFLSKQRLSSSGWRCTLRGKDVAVFQRKLHRRLPDVRPLLSSLCKCHHSSIVKLLGASTSADHIYLVYDFVPGASLSASLRNPKNPSFTVLHSWLSRLQIAADLADGLHYIHRSSGLNLRLVHNRIKSSSIIVSDPLLQAKICHFGTAQLTGELPDTTAETATEIQAPDTCSSSSSSISAAPAAISSSAPRRMRVQGTVGYMAPEISTAGIVSQKADVYSFGVVTLELLSGQEPLKARYDKTTKEIQTVSLIESAREAVAEGRVRQWVDRRMKDSFPVEVAERMVRVALDCVHVDPDQRPEMERVSGKVSRMLIESRNWADKLRVPTDFSVSMGPR